MDRTSASMTRPRPSDGPAGPEGRGTHDQTTSSAATTAAPAPTRPGARAAAPEGARESLLRRLFTGGPRPRLALVALCLAFFVVQLDVTVVNVAVETIGRELGGGVGDQQWIIAAYTVALAAGMLTAGSLGDRFGARRMCVIGLAVFGVASALCSLAPSMPLLIAARTLQGFGAAALLPCSLSLIVQQFTDSGQRARALGVWGGMGSLGMAAGPVFGGVLIEISDWRAIFLVNVPVCLATIVMTYMSVTESEQARDKALDLVGLVLGAVALAGISGGLIEAGQLGWSEPLPLAMMAVGLVVAVVFVLVERRREAPMLPLSIFSSSRFSGASAAGGIFNLCLYGTLLCVSLFMQGTLGESAFRSGMFLLPLTVAVGVGATLSGRLTARYGPRLPMLAGYGFGAVGAVVLMFAGSTGPLWLVVAGSVVLGLCSFAMPAMTSAAMSGVASEYTGIASGVLNTSRQAGGALGAAVLGSLLALGAGGMSLLAPMGAAVIAYLVAIGCTVIATRRSSSSD